MTYHVFTRYENGELQEVLLFDNYDKADEFYERMMNHFSIQDIDLTECELMT